MSAPWFKMYSADYLLDSKLALVSLEIQAIVVRLWCVCSRDTYFPDNPEMVSKLINVEAKTLKKHWPKVRTFFDGHISGLYSIRMEKERKEYTEKCAKLRANASHGGKAKAKHLLEPKASKCSTKVGLLNAAEGETETEITPYPLAGDGGEGGGLASLKSVWPKGRMNGVRPEHLQGALDSGATLGGLVHAAEAFLADPAACSGHRFAPALTTWLAERRWEPYLPTETQDGPFELAPDPLAVNHE